MSIFGPTFVYYGTFNKMEFLNKTEPLNYFIGLKIYIIKGLFGCCIRKVKPIFGTFSNSELLGSVGVELKRNSSLKSVHQFFNFA